MNQLIPILNQLQDVFTAVGASPIELPQLVVVGCQSSGKSSVLENIVGRDFLPRGAGIVTRRPLILQLIHTGEQGENEKQTEEKEFEDDSLSRSHALSSPEEKSSGDSDSFDSPSTTAAKAEREWGEFLHRPGQKFFDFHAIRDEIIRETDRLTGSNRGVSSVPISLKIYSPHVLNLTLVDLPGLTKVPVGDQPNDIAEQIHSMCLEYIANPSAIIIAVSAANQDIANSDALKIAREVDPQGQRTLGVITKIDLMDRGTDAMNILMGNVIHLHHGFVGVINRSQHDIHKSKSIQAALKSERQFFQTHAVYRSIASRLGTPYLAKRLNAILMQHIQDCLPEMRQKIALTIAETQAELESYGTPMAVQQISMGSMLLPMISAFCAHFNDALDGKSPEVSINELYGGARISYVFRELFSVALDHIQPFDTLSDHDIRTAIRNASGPKPSLFIPEISFELLVKRQIERLLTPSLDCVELVFHELQRVAMQCEHLAPQLNRFPRLKDRVMEVVNELLRSRMDPTRSVIQNIIHCELSYINTNHPDFIGGSKAVASIMERIQMQKAEEKRAGLDGKRKEKVVDSSMAQYPDHARSGIQAQLSHANSPAGNSANSKNQGGFFNSLFRSAAPDSAAAPHSAPSHSNFASALQHPAPAPAHNNSHAAAPQPIHPNVHSHSSHPAPAPAPVSSSHPLSVDSLQLNMRVLAPTDRELIETEVIKTLINSYFNIVRKNICDYIPKAIMGFLVNFTKKELQSELVKSLYKPNLFDSLLKEADDIAEKRASCQELLEILKRALEIVNSARDFNPMAV